jgi:hypothetical protein
MQAKVWHFLIHDAFQCDLLKINNYIFTSWHVQKITLNFPASKSKMRISRLQRTARSKSPTGQTDDGCGIPFKVLTCWQLKKKHSFKNYENYECKKT